MTSLASCLVELRFLYVGVAEVDRALAEWTGNADPTVRWRFRAFGADVAAIEVGSGPLVLLADHRPDGSVLPIWSVDSLEQVREALDASSWQISAAMGTPEGDAMLLTSSDGLELAVLEVTRPGAMDSAYADTANTRRVR